MWVEYWVLGKIRGDDMWREYCANAWDERVRPSQRDIGAKYKINSQPEGAGKANARLKWSHLTLGQQMMKVSDENG